MKAVAAIGFVLLASAAGAQTGGQPPAAATGDAAKGKALFLAYQCFACHGYNGETGTRLVKEDGSFVPRLLTSRGFTAFIRAPRPNERPPAGSSTTMPSYGVSSLSDEQAADLFAYIKTFKPTEPALKDIPVLSQMLKDGGKPAK